ncbi:MAG: aspartate aminotransferase family protein [Oscillospiraceae bacterium]|jgi:acetylornithine/N-succinyldiaminopimelate aminotransferase|nr:aspartate aminotransferase family protein [Oscillospiraceae bacterium]
MTTQELISQDKSHVMQTYGRFPVALERGEGVYLYSPEGRRYLDFTSGIGVNAIGYGDKKWAEAIYNQALKLGHTSNLYYTEPYIRLAEELTERSGLPNSRVFFANAGGEANEGLIKLARKYASDKGNPGGTIITLVNSFHGRTVTTLSATGQDKFHKHFFPFTEGFLHVPANDKAALIAALENTPNAIAVMAELVQGEGGVLPLEPDYVKFLREITESGDILLLVDEVQTGIGRTGTFFAYQGYGIEPDALSFAKGIAGGLPMGGLISSEKCADTLTPGDHGTTFGGNPIAAAAALEVVSRLTPEFLSDVAAKGEYVKERVLARKIPAVAEIRGRGLMLGAALTGVKPGDVVNACIEKGLLLLTAGSDALRIMPPLVITRAELDEGLEILFEVLEKI